MPTSRPALRTLPGPPDPHAPPNPPNFAAVTWKAGARIVRCGPESRDPANPLDPTKPYVSPSPARFSPFGRGKAGGGRLVPTLYGASTALGALSETILHDVPVVGDPKSVDYGRLNDRFLIDLVCDVPLNLANLTMPVGLRRINVARAELIECGSDQYRQTVKWAHAAYMDSRNFDGLTWVSRQDENSRALVLFGGRGTWEKNIHPVGPYPDSAKSPLTGPGTLDWILQLCDDAGVTVRGAPFMPS